MRVHILDSDGDLIEVSNDGAPAEWIKPITDIGEFVAYSAGDLARRVEVRENIIKSWICIIEDHEPEATSVNFRTMIVHAFTYWATDPDILREFHEKSPTQDGFVKIFLDGVKVGWQERRYN